MKTRIISIVIFLTSCTGLFSQPTVQWLNSVGGANHDPTWLPHFTDMAIDKNGNICVVCYDSSGGNFIHMTSKYDSHGNLRWNNKISCSPPGRLATYVTFDDIQNVYIAFQNNYGCEIRKYDPNGIEQWRTTYGFAAWPNGIAVDKYYNLYMIVWQSSFYTTVKFDQRGKMQWTAIYNEYSNGTSHSWGLALDNSQNIYVTGHCVNIVNNISDIVTIKYNPRGDSQWVSKYNETSTGWDVGRFVAIDPNGYVLVCAYSFNGMIITKHDPRDGRIMQVSQCNNHLIYWPNDFKVDDYGNSFATGYGFGSNGYYNMGTAKYDIYGNLQWGTASITGIGNSLFVDRDKNVYVTGNTIDSNFLTVKFDTDGQLKWGAVYDKGGIDNAYKIIVDDWRVYVTGFSQHGINGPFDCITLQYDQTGLSPSPLTLNNNNSETPGKFSLDQNYPNPFNPSTKIKFDIPASVGVAAAKLVVYDITGKQVAELVNQSLKPGTYEVEFDGSRLSSGTYFYRLDAGSFTDIKKMILIK